LLIFLGGVAMSNAKDEKGSTITKQMVAKINIKHINGGVIDIILFGMQGSGKGTQGKILADRYDLKIFDMGFELREIISSRTPLGEKIKETVERGDLVDDDTIMEVVENFIKNLPSPDQSLIFDGIPRTKKQHQKLLSILKVNDRDAFALLIKISKEESIRRLTQRRICPKCGAIYPVFYADNICEHDQVGLITRSDDANIDAVTRRIENYTNETVPVIRKFYEVNRLIEINGEQDILDVTKETIKKASHLFVLNL